MENNTKLLPREKAARFGLKALSDSELMAIVFSTGIQGKNVFELCDDILSDNEGHLCLIAATSLDEFKEKYRGIGPAKALTLLAGIELGVRAAADAAVYRHKVLSSSQAVYEYIKPKYYLLDHEQFWAIYLRQNNSVIKAVKIGQGGMSATAVDMRIVLREALLQKAAALILTHNHPSGNLRPSQQDLALTRRIKEAAALMDIRLHDHLIVADNGFFSFNDQGCM